jgi:MSHA biogenesis protein MshN
MSLVNQVLNDLEKRGVNVTQADASIRAVPSRKQTKWIPFVLGALSLLLLAAAAKWYLGREEVVVAEPEIVANADKFVLVSGLSDVAVQSAVMPVSAVAEGGSVSMVAAAPVIGQPSAAEEEVAPVRIKKRPVRMSAIPVDGEASIKRGASTESAAVSNPYKKISPRQHAENEFNKANQAAQQGRTQDAITGYQGVLKLDPLYHDARRALVGVLLGAKRNTEAEEVLQDGLNLDSHESSLAMILARLQVERGAVPEALETLQKTLPYAESRADYQSFMAALLQRQERHQEAVTYFQKALVLAPDNGVWLMGMGISLQALQRKEEARAAYQRALVSNSLNAQLREFVQQKLKEL